MSTETGKIKLIDGHSVHRITSGQVVTDLQTAVKELVENSLDAGATNIEVRFKEYGLKTIEVIDNGSGISPEDHDCVALKHHTSKLTTFEDLSTVLTFGFRGEALSSLCALSENVTVVTARTEDAPMGTVLELDKNGTVKEKGRVARQRGTTITITGLFKPLPVRHKEFQRNAKREFGKALNLLNAYALVPCVDIGSKDKKGVRLSVSNHPDAGRKTIQLCTDGTPSVRASVASLWGPKAVDHLVDLDVSFTVQAEQSVRKRMEGDVNETEVRVKGLVSKFAVGCGRTGTDRQFFFVNGRPCAPVKVQKAFNEVYRSFNANQSPFIVADFSIPTKSCDINVSPDKRTIFLHSENNLMIALKNALEEAFAPSRSTYDIGGSQIQLSKEKRRRGGTSSQSQCLDRSGARSTDNKKASGLEDDSVQGPKDHDDRPETENEDESVVESMATDNTRSAPRERAAIHSPSGSQQSSLLGLDDNTCLSSQSPSSPQRTLVTTSNNNSQEDDPAFSGVATAPNFVHKGYLALQRRETRTPEQDDVVLDTTSASWNKRSVQVTEDNDKDLEAPPRKKRRPNMSANALEVGGREVSCEAEGKERGKGKSSSRNRNDTRVKLREKLSEFARHGSQVANIDLDEDEESDKTISEGGQGEQEDVNVEVWEGRVKEEPTKMCRKGREKGIQPNEGASEIMDDVTMSADDNANHDAGQLPVGSGIPEKEKPASVTSPTADGSVSDASNDVSMLDIVGESGSSHSCESRPEIIRSVDRDNVFLRFDLSRISITWHQLKDRLAKPSSAEPSIAKAGVKILIDAGVTNTDDNDTAANALARVIDKEDFKLMDIVGQFNLGFIVARRRKLASSEGGGLASMMDDLFIIDQHAADEKYNFETLQQTTNIESQRLLRPQPLELTAADELLAVENIEVLRQNGFEIDVNGDKDTPAGNGQRLRLVAQPVSKSTVFDTKDLEELIHLMQDQPRGRMVRCSKARAMFAMRACRKSVMVGKTLTKNQMASVVQHMGTMDQPWHCPHGRPTMRHLSAIGNVGGERSRAVNWTAFDLV